MTRPRLALITVACALGALLAPTATLASSDGLSTSWSGDGVALGDISNAPKIKLIYAFAAGQPNRLSAVGPVIQQELEAASEQILNQSGGRLTMRWDRQSTNTQYLDIQAVQLPESLGYYRTDPNTALSRVRADLAGYTASSLTDNFLVFADNVYTESATGIADNPQDTQPGTANATNYGGRMGVVLGDGSSWFHGQSDSALSGSLTPLHEIFHTLGAVSPTAPNSDGTGHCNQRYDLMCYAALWYPLQCPKTIAQPYAIDCGGDDYFNAINPSGYLASNWNIANSWFLTSPSSAAAFTQAPDAQLSASAYTVTAGGAVTLNASSTYDDGGVARYLFDLDGDGRYETDNGTSPVLTTALNKLGAYRISMRAIDLAGAYGVASVSVNVVSDGGGGGTNPPANRAPIPMLGVSTGSPAVGKAVTFSAGGSYDPDGSGISYLWDFNGDGRTDSASSIGSYSYPAAGSYTVTLTVTDVTGLSARATATVTATSKSGGGLSITKTSSAQKESTITKSGLKVAGISPAKGTIKVTFKLGSKSLGSGSIKITKAGSFAKTIKLTSSGRSTLQKLKGTATVKVTATLGKSSASKTVRVK